MLVRSRPWWFVLDHAGLFSTMLVCSRPCWFVLDHAGLFSTTLVQNSQTKLPHVWFSVMFRIHSICGCCKVSVCWRYCCYCSVSCWCDYFWEQLKAHSNTMLLNICVPVVVKIPGHVISAHHIHMQWGVTIIMLRTSNQCHYVGQNHLKSKVT